MVTVCPPPPPALLAPPPCNGLPPPPPPHALRTSAAVAAMPTPLMPARLPPRVLRDMSFPSWEGSARRCRATHARRDGQPVQPCERELDKNGQRDDEDRPA